MAASTSRAAWWLSAYSASPASARAAWDRGALAAIPSSGDWRVVEAPLIRSVLAMQQIGSDRLGPALAAPASGLAWWLVPAEEADQLDDLLTVHPAGWVLRCPPPAAAIEGRFWLELPDGSGRLTSAALLGAAFGPTGAVER
ncbi:hypothetical protein [Streptomyces sp. SCA2-2]|uniref:hypothetical protein n=1 Tax=Streptomyces sp. SCA2-2 TaxID=1563677 RepID=UPI0010216924|nr:hypothetical protein [Streptomyces sp. SCA2-2]RZE89205.1 hypothetical protein C0L86_29080 [Streptomyces sp. SCA2-2]